jgi:hypothetical protein
VPISSIDAISPAFRHARQQLSQPFRAGQWARLAFVGLLAGELSSGGCSGSNFQIPRSNGGNHFVGTGLPAADPAFYFGLIALLAVLGLVMWLLFIYVNSVMRFVLFDSVVEKECHIRKGWNRRTGAGFRYFLWQLLFSLAMLMGLTILVGIPAAMAFALGWLKEPGEHVLPLVLGGVILFFLLFAFVICALVVQVFSKDFVVPQMALEGISAIEGWQRLLAMLKHEKGGYAGYLGMKIVMAIAAAIVVGIVTTIALLLILIPVGGLGAIAVFGGKAAGLTWNLYTITLAVVIGSVVLALILYVFSLISVPAIAFFPAYSIYFFAARYRPLALALYPAPPAPPEPPPVPSEPPPAPLLPPEPEPIG